MITLFQVYNAYTITQPNNRRLFKIHSDTLYNTATKCIKTTSEINKLFRGLARRLEAQTFGSSKESEIKVGGSIEN